MTQSAPTHGLGISVWRIVILSGVLHVPEACIVYLGDRSAYAIVRAATPRQKWHNKLFQPLTLGCPALALNLCRQVPGRVVTRISQFEVTCLARPGQAGSNHWISRFLGGRLTTLLQERWQWKKTKTNEDRHCDPTIVNLTAPELVDPLCVCVCVCVCV